MAFKKGQSGNPAGKPRGKKSQSTILRESLAPDLPAVLKKVKEQALDGDMVAAKILLDRTLPPVRTESAAVNIPKLKTAQTLTDKAKAIVDAVADGSLSPSAASDLLSALGAVAKIIEIEDLEARIPALEAQEDK